MTWSLHTYNRCQDVLENRGGTARLRCFFNSLGIAAATSCMILQGAHAELQFLKAS